MSRNNARDLYNSGFGGSMVSVVPPGVKTVDAIAPDAPGKCPGKRRRDGVWYPCAVSSTSCASLAEAEEWDAWGANVGLACGREAKLVALDSDVDDPEAARCVNLILKKFFPFWRGVDDPNHVRLLFPFRVSGALPRGTTYTFVKGDKIIKIDLLSDGKQFVAAGVHARTGKLIVWNEDITSFMDGAFEFPEKTLEQLEQIVQEVTDGLKALGWGRTSGVVSADTGAGHTAERERRTGTEKEISRWLALVPNGPNDTQFDERAKWVAMAHAIRGASQGAEWGKEQWLMWCAQRDQEPGQPEHVWDSLGDDGRLGLDYIRERARERNPKLAAQLDFEFADRIDDDRLNAIAAGYAQGSLWPIILNRYVWISTKDCFYDLYTGAKFSQQGINGKFGHLTQKLLKEGFPNINTKKPVSFSFSQLFHMHPDAVKADSFTYWPGQPRLVNGKNDHLMVNRWHAAEFKYVPGITENDVRKWIDLVTLVLGNARDALLFIKYLAFVIKFPHLKPNWAPVIMTIPGLGKDTMLRPVLLAVGDGNFFMVSADDLSKGWTPFLESRFVYMSEMRQHSRGNKSSHDVMNDLKAYLADKPEWVGVTRKGIDTYMARNCTAWVFFSNEKKPLYVGDGDRRLWIIDNMGQQKKDPAYYADINKELDANGHLVASWLQDYPLTAADVALFLGPAPDTAAKQMLIAVNRDPVETTIAEIIEDARQGGLFSSNIVTSEDLRAEIKNRLSGNVPSPQMLAMYLRNLGAEPLVKDQGGGAGAGVVALPDGRRKRLWLLAPTDAKGRDYSKLSVKEAADLYVSSKWPANTQYHTSTGKALTAIDGGDDI